MQVTPAVQPARPALGAESGHEYIPPRELVRVPLNCSLHEGYLWRTHRFSLFIHSTYPRHPVRYEVYHFCPVDEVFPRVIKQRKGHFEKEIPWSVIAPARREHIGVKRRHSHGLCRPGAGIVSVLYVVDETFHTLTPRTSRTALCLKYHSQFITRRRSSSFLGRTNFDLPVAAHHRLWDDLTLISQSPLIIACGTT